MKTSWAGYPQADGRRRHAEILPRPADQRIPDCRHWTAAHRVVVAEDEEALPHGSKPESHPRFPTARHSRQSGCSGTPQETDWRSRAVRRCKIKWNPAPRRRVEFVNDIFGGASPRTTFPVEKGIRDAAARGYLAGFPVVDFKVTLYDARITTWIRTTCHFRWRGGLRSKKPWNRQSPPFGAIDVGRDFSPG